MTKTRLGVIGGGHLGKIHARLACRHEDAELVFVADPSAHARTQIENVLAEENHSANVLDTYEGVIEEIDAAIIAAPTSLHETIGVQLLEAGCHVLMEKPIAPSTSQAQHLVSAAQHNQCILQVGHVERFNPCFQSLGQKESTPYYIEAHRMGGFTFRSTDVGVVMDLMIHDIDLALHLAGSQVVDVDAIGISVFGENEDIAQARLNFANGCVANLTASRASFSPRRDIQWLGPDGFCQLDLVASKITTVRPDELLANRSIDVLGMAESEQQAFRDELFEKWMPVETVDAQPTNAILDEQQDFIRSIQNRRTPQVTGQDGMNAVTVAEQVLACIQEHAWGDSPHAPRGPLVTRSQLESANRFASWVDQHRRAG